ncbi:MAG: ABC transporter ATP-binding protein [Candidatus Hatepunaea meridiana]|nr:ABC transporter ATP-binding protein [Candidatus Hatepunaea meridiana]
MLAKRNCTNEELISRYTDQPSEMPRGLRDKIEKQWNNGPVQLYAMADLNASLKLTHTWIALGSEHISIVSDSGRDNGEIKNIELSQIQTVQETPCLSCTNLTLFGEPDEPPLAVLHYTHRQRRAMENIKFIIEQRIKGHTVGFDKEAKEAYSDAMTQPIKEAQASVAANKMAVVWRLMGYLTPYRKRLSFGLVAAAIMTLVSLLPAYLTGYVIDKVIKPFQNGKIDYEAAMYTAWVIIGALALTYILRVFCMWIRLHKMSVLGELVAGDLRRDIYEHLQRLSLSFFSKKQTGSLISRVSSDSDRLWEFIAFGVVEVSLSVIMLLGLGTVLMTMDWQLGLILTLPIPLFLWTVFAHGSRMQRLFISAWRKWSDMTAVLSDTIPGMRVVKAFNQEDREKERFDGRNMSCVAHFNHIHDVWTKFWPILLMGIHIITLSVWAFALPRVFGQGTSLSVGTFVTFLLYMGMYLQPIETIGLMARMMNRATSSAHRIFEVLDTEPEIVDRIEPVRLEPLQGRVTFENVTFAYDGIRQIIRGISFNVMPGEMIGLVGPSGAGKTTITNLIARFYDVTGGKILIDGVNIHNLDTGHFRRQVGMVLQDPYLFHGTILENILYGQPDAGMERVIEAAKTANAHDFILKLPHGYETIIGERGHTLSGGERQRVSIARAVLCNPRILILDEATSSVDTETERNIQQALDRLIAGRTVFAIAHRLSTLRNATRLIVIEDGRITEEGTHSELLSNPDGTYTKLQKMQQELHEAYAV